MWLVGWIQPMKPFFWLAGSLDYQRLGGHGLLWNLGSLDSAGYGDDGQTPGHVLLPNHSPVSLPTSGPMLQPKHGPMTLHALRPMQLPSSGPVLPLCCCLCVALSSQM